MQIDEKQVDLIDDQLHLITKYMNMIKNNASKRHPK